MTATTPTHARRPGNARCVYSRMAVIMAAAWVAVVVVPGLVRAGDPAEGGAARELRPLLDAIRHVETGGHPDPANAVGDNGRSIGPYQIQRAYWQDSRVPGQWEDVRDRAYAERVMRAYWARYCPAALERGDWQTLARIHNRGPGGAQRTGTLGYWTRVKIILDKRQGPATMSPGGMK